MIRYKQITFSGLVVIKRANSSPETNVEIINDMQITSALFYGDSNRYFQLPSLIRILQKVLFWNTFKMIKLQKEYEPENGTSRVHMYDLIQKTTHLMLSPLYSESKIRGIVQEAYTGYSGVRAHHHHVPSVREKFKIHQNSHVNHRITYHMTPNLIGPPILIV